MSMVDIMNIAVYNSAYIWVYLLNAKLWVKPKAKLEMDIRNRRISTIVNVPLHLTYLKV